MNLLQIVLNESKKFLRLFILKVKKQELIEFIVVFQVFWIAQKLVKNLFIGQVYAKSGW